MGSTSGTPDELARATELLWGAAQPYRRGPRPTLRLEDIARAGIEIADSEGLAALTMQRVAVALGFTKMALYRHVPGKVELIALMTDIGIGEPPRIDHRNGWRQRLDTWARLMRDRFSLHPWALETTVGVRAIGPNELGWLEAAIAALADTGLDGGEKIDVAVTLLGQVRTVVQQEASLPPGGSEDAMRAGFTALLTGREARFPALAVAVESVAGRASGNQALDFGLERVLDGVERLIGERA